MESWKSGLPVAGVTLGVALLGRGGSGVSLGQAGPRTKWMCLEVMCCVARSSATSSGDWSAGV